MWEAVCSNRRKSYFLLFMLASALEKISGDKEDMPIPLTHLAATHSLPVRDGRHWLKLGRVLHDLMVLLCGFLEGPVKVSASFQSRPGSRACP